MLTNEQPPSLNFTIRFPNGIIGFGQYKDFALLYPGKGEVACLQAIEEPNLSLLVSEWDERRLGEKPELHGEQFPKAEEEVVWLLVLNPSGSPDWITANAKAPILVGVESRMGRQIVLESNSYSIKAPWIRKKKAPPPAGE